MTPDPLGEAVAWVRDAGLVAYPTETVWGLGADATSEEAVTRLRRWKGRGDASPLSVLVETRADLAELGVAVSAAAEDLAARLWPGPLTLVFPCRRAFPPGVTRDDGALGVRCSSHPAASALARRLRSERVGPVTATSLNHTGEESAADAEAARSLCGSGPDEPHLLDAPGPDAGRHRESTVVDVTGEEPRVLRWGAFGEEDLFRAEHAR